MNDQQVQRMLNDTIGICVSDEGAAGLPYDLCCHIRALADDRERLREGLKMMAQIRSVNGKTPLETKIADAILAGADVRQVEEGIRVAQGTWKPPHGGFNG